MRDVGGELGPMLHPGDLVISGQPEQVPLAWYYLPRGLHFADPTGLSKDPQSMNWVHALNRLQAANPAATLDPLIASLKPGQQLLYVRPLTEGANSWEASWTQLVRRRSAQWGAILSSTPTLKVVAPGAAQLPWRLLRRRQRDAVPEGLLSTQNDRYPACRRCLARR